MKTKPFLGLVKIKRGAAIFQDHGFTRWPYIPGSQRPKLVDADLVFEARPGPSNGLELVRHGYGVLLSKHPGAYGNGSIFVSKGDVTSAIAPCAWPILWGDSDRDLEAA